MKALLAKLLAAEPLLMKAAKTAVFTFIGIVGANVAGWTNVADLKTAGIIALSAGASLLVNALLTWASS